MGLQESGRPSYALPSPTEAGRVMARITGPGSGEPRFPEPAGASEAPSRSRRLGAHDAAHGTLGVGSSEQLPLLLVASRH
jgi:hypothetical protein